MNDKVVNIIEKLVNTMVPDTINSIVTNVGIRKVRSEFYPDEESAIVVYIRPKYLSKSNDFIVSCKIETCFFPEDFSETSLAYDKLTRDISDLVIEYTKNVIRITNNRVVDVIHREVDFKDNE